MSRAFVENNQKSIVIKPNEQREVFDIITADEGAQRGQGLCIKAKRGSHVTYILALFGGQEVKRNVTLLLQEGAEGRIVGIVLGEDKGMYDIRTVLHHKGAHTIGDIKMKIVLKDEAQITYDGLIKIDKQAHETNSYLSGKALALNRGVRCDAKPELEIEANDVKASHSFSQGQIDPEQLFYLKSRGLSEEEAKRMIVEGFLLDVLCGVSEDVRKTIHQELDKLNLK